MVPLRSDQSNLAGPAVIQQQASSASMCQERNALGFFAQKHPADEKLGLKVMNISIFGWLMEYFSHVCFQRASEAVNCIKNGLISSFFYFTGVHSDQKLDLNH